MSREVGNKSQSSQDIEETIPRKKSKVAPKLSICGKTLSLLPRWIDDMSVRVRRALGDSSLSILKRRREKEPARVCRQHKWLLIRRGRPSKRLILLTSNLRHPRMTSNSETPLLNFQKQTVRNLLVKPAASEKLSTTVKVIPQSMKKLTKKIDSPRLKPTFLAKGRIHLNQQMGSETPKTV